MNSEVCGTLGSDNPHDKSGITKGSIKSYDLANSQIATYKTMKHPQESLRIIEGRHMYVNS